MEKNLNAVIPYSIVSIILVVLSSLSTSLSFILLFAFVPVFIILKDLQTRDEGSLKYALALFFILGISSTLILILNSAAIPVYYTIIYALGLAIFTSLYWLVKKYLNSKLGLITLIIYWLSFEYLMVLVQPTMGNVLIFGDLNNLPTIHFSPSTGFLGYTLWGLSANIILSFVLYSPDTKFNIKLRWLSLTYAVIIISSPIWISQLWSTEAPDITRELMIQLYSGAVVDIDTYQLNGEWLGRTCSWVAVLLTIYALVKKKITK